MAATITTDSIVDGSRNLVLNIHITGDAGGDVTNEVVIDASTFDPAFLDAKIMEIEVHLAGFSAEFYWDADTNVQAFAGVNGESHHTWWKAGGLINNAGTGKTGDLLMSTTGLTSNRFGNIIVTLVKKQLA